MSSRTPVECVDVATDSTASDEDRTDAIHALKQANECSELDALARNEDIGERFRREALRALATPQCESTLRELVGRELLDSELHATASDLLGELDDE